MRADTKVKRPSEAKEVAEDIGYFAQCRISLQLDDYKEREYK